MNTQQHPRSPVDATGSLDAGLTAFIVDALETPAIVARIDDPHTVVFANPALDALRGAPPRPAGKPARGKDFRALFRAPPEGGSWKVFFAALASGKPLEAELSLNSTRRPGAPVPVEVRFTPVPDPDGRFTRFVAVLHDSRPRLYAEKERRDIARNLDCVIVELSRRALRDSLTDLPNRFYFRREIGDNLAEAQATNGEIGVVLLDLDNFKAVNDTFGHRTGDTLLCRIADGLRGLLRDGEYLVRWGGDEFLWIVPKLTDERELIGRFPGILQAVREAGPPDATLPITASLGHAVYPRHGRTPDELVQAADAAMYRAKRSGKIGPVPESDDASKISESETVSRGDIL